MREAGAEHHAAGRRPVRGPGRGGAAFQIQLLGCELQVLGFRRKSTFALEGSIAETTAHMLKKCSEATRVPHSDQVSPRSARHPSWWRPEGSPRRWSVWGGVLAVGRVPVSLLYHPTHCFEPRHFKRPTNTLHLYKEIDASRFFGARKMFCWREKYSTLEKSSSKTFNVEKISVKKFNVENFQRRKYSALKKYRRKFQRWKIQR